MKRKVEKKGLQKEEAGDVTRTAKAKGDSQFSIPFLSVSPVLTSVFMVVTIVCKAGVMNGSAAFTWTTHVLHEE